MLKQVLLIFWLYSVMKKTNSCFSFKQVQKIQPSINNFGAQSNHLILRCCFYQKLLILGQIC